MQGQISKFNYWEPNFSLDQLISFPFLIFTLRKTSHVIQMILDGTGEIVSKERMRHFAAFGGVTVEISKDEVASIKNDCNGNPECASLLLLGFKPLPRTYEFLSTVKFVDKSIFVYPNDKVVKGSEKAFATLHKSMVKKQIMGIGELLLRVSSTSRLVAIIPQKEEYEQNDDEESYTQISPPGLLLVPLAFEDDMRVLLDTHNFEASKEMVHAAMELIRHQNIEDSIEIGQSFENPGLKNFWNLIEAVALDIGEENDSDDEDGTKMNVIEKIVSTKDLKIRDKN